MLRTITFFLLTLFLTSCTPPQDEITLYTSIDEPFARPLVTRFEQQTGLKVRLITDTEATKTAGLAERLQAERDRPRADVYWGNEPFHTLRLASAGVLATYAPPEATDVPAQFKGPTWTGLGYRCRMLALSTRPDAEPLTRDLHSLLQLTDPRLKGRIALASPATGTTSGHLAALYVAWGEPRYRAWLEALRANDIKLLGGNSVVADYVASGTLLAGLTDNDDLAAALAQSSPPTLRGQLPDQTPTDAGGGTLLVPTTLALVQGAPHPQAGKQLIAFLLSPDTEQYLIDQKFLHGSLRTLDHDHVKPLQVDLQQVSNALKPATEMALTVLQDRK